MAGCSLTGGSVGGGEEGAEEGEVPVVPSTQGGPVPPDGAVLVIGPEGPVLDALSQSGARGGRADEAFPDASVLDVPEGSDGGDPRRVGSSVRPAAEDTVPVPRAGASTVGDSVPTVEEGEPARGKRPCPEETGSASSEPAHTVPRNTPQR